MFDDIGDAVLLIVVCVCVRKSFLSLYGSCYYVVMITVNSVFWLNVSDLCVLSPILCAKRLKNRRFLRFLIGFNAFFCCYFVFICVFYKNRIFLQYVNPIPGHNLVLDVEKRFRRCCIGLKTYK